MSLSKQDILAVNDRKPQTIDVPEWGGQVIVMPMSGKDRLTFELMVSSEKQLTSIGVYSQILVRCLVNDNGIRLFNDDEIDLISQKNAAVLTRLAPIAQRLSGLAPDDIDDAKKG